MTNNTSLKCDVCGKPAVYNLQNWWHLYKIRNDNIQLADEFEEINDWEGDTNEFYCQKCAEKEEII